MTKQATQTKPSSTAQLPGDRLPIQASDDMTEEQPEVVATPPPPSPASLETTSITQPGWAVQLREPFDPALVGKLPRVTCKSCSDNKRDRHCTDHKMVKCKECNNWISEKHVHLDYVGHAEVTDRLLSVDPWWEWEPVAFDADGLPKLDHLGGLWIRLTVTGVTRLGYGDAQGKNGPNAVKEAIGDALRNASMRFGVGLDLWSKSDMHELRAREAAAASPTVNLWTYITGTAEDGLPRLTKAERQLLSDSWKSDFDFPTTAVPVEREAACRVLIDSYVGTFPDSVVTTYDPDDPERPFEDEPVAAEAVPAGGGS